MIDFVKKRLQGPVEFRYDPLTKWQSRVNPERAKRLRQGQGAGDRDTTPWGWAASIWSPLVQR